ncbi:MAG: DUF3137 domain-containing protein [Acidobacteria bacterium]|nr:DUF3137 domain-containing protein [Acidobacteriota bacterium]
MGLLRNLFGPSREEIWRQLAAETGAEYVEGNWRKADKVQAQVKQWTITLDTYTVSTGKTYVTFTRFRAPYVNADGFRFKIYRKSMFSGLGKALGMQDVEIGEPQFDEAFIIQGNDEARLRQFFANPTIRQLLSSQPEVNLEVKDDEGYFSTQFPEGVDELHFFGPGIITDVERLKQLYELFATVLDQLCQIGSAYETDPQVAL